MVVQLYNFVIFHTRQFWANHELPCATKLYHRTRDQIMLDEVERIEFEHRDPSRGETMAAKDKFATIYARCDLGLDLGFRKYEGKLLDFGEKPDAQYDKMSYVTFVPRGKRKPKTLSENFLILDGVGYPDPPDAWVYDEPNRVSDRMEER